MPFEDPWLREGKISPLEWERRMFQKTENALHAWRALAICASIRRHDAARCDTLPPWLLEYVLTSATSFEELIEDEPDDDFPTLIAIALHFRAKGQGVRRAIVRNHERDLRDFQIAIELRGARRLQPAEPLEGLVAGIAEARQLSPETVWRAWSRWNAFIDEAFPAE